ncbi:hypothetical protein ABEF79_08725 [Acinetobacter sp. ANC 7454]|uniref:hypothetical protein n=1 Tax=Acinetobacter thermotolerans TaxID=3151487 RepID=UPI00325BB050
MRVVKSQNAIDIYPAKEDSFIVISEENGFFNERDGEYSDVYINIDVAHIDSVIQALQNAKKEILER